MHTAERLDAGLRQIVAYIVPDGPAARAALGPAQRLCSLAPNVSTERACCGGSIRAHCQFARAYSTRNCSRWGLTASRISCSARASERPRFERSEATQCMAAAPHPRGRGPSTPRIAAAAACAQRCSGSQAGRSRGQQCTAREWRILSSAPSLQNRRAAGLCRLLQLCLAGTSGTVPLTRAQARTRLYPAGMLCFACPTFEWFTVIDATRG